MKRFLFCIASLVLCLVSQQQAQAQPQLASGQPLLSGGSEGLAPLSFYMTYSNRPRGYAYMSSEQYPDFFVLITSGLPESRGIFVCEFDKVSSDGSLVYKKPRKVSHPYGDKNPSSMFRVLQTKKKIYGIWLSSTRIMVTEYDKVRERFEKIAENKITGIDYNLQSFDFSLNGKHDLEVVMLCNDGTQYRPETFKGDTQSYYDGADIYRGKLPRSGVFHMKIDTYSWEQAGRVRQISHDMNVMVGASEIAVVRSADGKLDGYVVGSMLGSLKYLPKPKKNNQTSTPKHLKTRHNTVLVNPSYSTRLIPFADKDSGQNQLLIGGESAICHYRFTGEFTDSGEPIFTDPEMILQRDGEMYSGSLTVPNVVDWDGDGVLDIVAGNSEGRMLFFKNAGTNRNPDFMMGQQVYSAGEPILFRPGYHVVQGPFEASWGYLCPTVYDWNGDGLPDVVFSGSRAKFEVMLNHGTRTEPKLGAPVAIKLDNLELWGTWRVKPGIAQVNGSNVMVIMDDENALHLYRQVDNHNVEDAGKLRLKDGSQITGHNNLKESLGQWGRGKINLVDWDGDGNLDIIIGSIKRSSFPHPDRGLPLSRMQKKRVGMQVMFLRNAGTNDKMVFEEPVQFQFRGKDLYLGAHSNAPTPCLLGDISDGTNLLVGVESGKFFFFQRKDLNTVGIDD